MRIKGYDLNDLADFAREKLPDSWKGIFEDAGLPARAKANGWYPLEAFCQVLESLEQRLGTGSYGSVAIEYGRYSARKEAEGAHRLLFVFASPFFLLKRANAFWGFYHDFGTVIIIPETDNSARFCLVRCGELPRIYPYDIIGWVEGALTLAGSENPKVEFLGVLEEGYCFRAQW